VLESFGKPILGELRREILFRALKGVAIRETASAIVLRQATTC
jgi:hypothetical protein